MNIRTAKFEQLSADEIAAWSALQRAYPAFSSPYFRPEFTQLIAAVRPGVEVAVLQEAGVPVGFFPFQRTLFNAGQPVGGGTSEFHALIAPPDFDCDPLELLSACRLSSWRFDHLIPIHSSFQRFAWSDAESPYIDLSDGFENYIARRPNGRRLMSEYGQSSRKIEREVGPIRFEAHVSDPDVLATCLAWKSAQALRTGRVDIFKYSWLTRFIQSILACRGEDFGPLMQVYYIGTQIAAITFGVRSRDEFHPWYPTYNVQFANYSPGYLHWIEMMKAAESVGIRRIILGKGEESYKRRLMSGVDRVVQGCVDVRPAVAAARQAWRHTRATIKASPLQSAARAPARIVNRIGTWLMFR